MALDCAQERGVYMRILIVDDDRVSREVLYKVASAYGNCDLAIDGIEAVEAYSFSHDEGCPYDVIILDIMMPLFEGNKVLKRIRAFEAKNNITKENRIKAVIVSALYSPRLLEELNTYEISEYIRKPLSVEVLKKVLDSIKTG